MRKRSIIALPSEQALTFNPLAVLYEMEGMDGRVIGQTTVLDVLGACSDENPVEIHPEGAVMNAGVEVDTVNFHVVRTVRRFFGFRSEVLKDKAS